MITSTTQHPHHPQHYHHRQRRRSVTFSETSQQILVRDLSNISEKDTLWYSSEELIASKANLLFCKEKVRESISKQQTPSASDILGLEKYLTEQLTIEYMNRRHMLRKRVLDEARWQEMIINQQQRRHQHTDGNYMTIERLAYEDNQQVDTLARVSFEHSRWAYERARAAALFFFSRIKNKKMSSGYNSSRSS
jgi:hypothetical protein